MFLDEASIRKLYSKKRKHLDLRSLDCGILSIKEFKSLIGSIKDNYRKLECVRIEKGFVDNLTKYQVPAIFQVVGEEPQKLRKLKLVSGTKWSNQGVWSLPVAGVSTTIRKGIELQELICSKVCLTGQEEDFACLIGALEQHPSLQRLEFWDSDLSEDALYPLLQALAKAPKMHSIVLSFLTDQGNNNNNSNSSSSRTTTNNNSNNYFFSIGATVESQEQIATICHSKTLQYLMIQNVHLTDGAVMQLAKSLQVNETMEHLSLINCRITDVAGIAIAKMIQLNHSLQKLELDQNQLTDDACVEISNSLRINSTLKYLSLKGNPQITIKGYEALVTMLKDQNITLRQLETNAHDDIRSEIQSLLSDNEKYCRDVGKVFRTMDAQLQLAKPLLAQEKRDLQSQLEAATIEVIQLQQQHQQSEPSQNKLPVPLELRQKQPKNIQHTYTKTELGGVRDMEPQLARATTTIEGWKLQQENNQNNFKKAEGKEQIVVSNTTHRDSEADQLQQENNQEKNKSTLSVHLELQEKQAQTGQITVKNNTQAEHEGEVCLKDTNHFLPKAKGLSESQLGAATTSSKKHVTPKGGGLQSQLDVATTQIIKLQKDNDQRRWITSVPLKLEEKQESGKMILSRSTQKDFSTERQGVVAINNNNDVLSPKSTEEDCPTEREGVVAIFNSKHFMAQEQFGATTTAETSKRQEDNDQGEMDKDNYQGQSSQNNVVKSVRFELNEEREIAVLKKTAKDIVTELEGEVTMENSEVTEGTRNSPFVTLSHVFSGESAAVMDIGEEKSLPPPLTISSSSDSSECSDDIANMEPQSCRVKRPIENFDILLGSLTTQRQREEGGYHPLHKIVEEETKEEEAKAGETPDDENNKDNGNNDNDKEAEQNKEGGQKEKEGQKGEKAKQFVDSPKFGTNHAKVDSIVSAENIHLCGKLGSDSESSAETPTVVGKSSSCVKVKVRKILPADNIHLYGKFGSDSESSTEIPTAPGKGSSLVKVEGILKTENLHLCGRFMSDSESSKSSANTTSTSSTSRIQNLETHDVMIEQSTSPQLQHLEKNERKTGLEMNQTGPVVAHENSHQVEDELDDCLRRGQKSQYVPLIESVNAQVENVEAIFKHADDSFQQRDSNRSNQDSRFEKGNTQLQVANDAIEKNTSQSFIESLRKESDDCKFTTEEQLQNLKDINAKMKKELECLREEKRKGKSKSEDSLEAIIMIEGESRNEAVSTEEDASNAMRMKDVKTGNEVVSHLNLRLRHLEDRFAKEISKFISGQSEYETSIKSVNARLQKFEMAFDDVQHQREILDVEETQLQNSNAEVRSDLNLRLRQLKDQFAKELSEFAKGQSKYEPLIESVNARLQHVENFFDEAERQRENIKQVKLDGERQLKLFKDHYAEEKNQWTSSIELLRKERDNCRIAAAEELRNLKDKFENEKKQWTASMESLESQNKRNVKVNAEMKSQLEFLEEEKSRDKFKFQESVESIKIERDNKNEVVSQLNLQIQRLRDQYEKETGDLKFEQQSLNVNFQKDREEWASSMELLESQNKNYVEVNTELKNQLESLEEERGRDKSKFEESLEAIKIERDNKNEAISQLNLQIQDLRHQYEMEIGGLKLERQSGNDRLEKEKKEWKTSMESLESQNKNYVEINVEMKRKLESVEEEKIRDKYKRTEAVSQLNLQIQDLRDQYKKEIGELKLERQRLNDRLEKEKEKWTTFRESLERQNKQYIEINAEMKIQLECLEEEKSKQKSKFEESLEATKVERNRMCETISQLRSQIQDLRDLSGKEICEMKLERESLYERFEKEKTEWVSSMESLKNQNKTYVESNAKISKQLECLIEEKSREKSKWINSLQAMKVERDKECEAVSQLNLQIEDIKDQSTKEICELKLERQNLNDRFQREKKEWVSSIKSLGSQSKDYEEANAMMKRQLESLQEESGDRSKLEESLEAMKIDRDSKSEALSDFNLQVHDLKDQFANKINELKLERDNICNDSGNRKGQLGELKEQCDLDNPEQGRYCKVATEQLEQMYDQIKEETVDWNPIEFLKVVGEQYVQSVKETNALLKQHWKEEEEEKKKQDKVEESSIQTATTCSMDTDGQSTAEASCQQLQKLSYTVTEVKGLLHELKDQHKKERLEWLLSSEGLQEQIANYANAMVEIRSRLHHLEEQSTSEKIEWHIFLEALKADKDSYCQTAKDLRMQLKQLQHDQRVTQTTNKHAQNEREDRKTYLEVDGKPSSNSTQLERLKHHLIFGFIIVITAGLILCSSMKDPMFCFSSSEFISMAQKIVWEGNPIIK